MNIPKADDERYLGPIKYRGRFFLKLVKKLNFPSFHIHVMEDRHGRQAMFYNIKIPDDVTINEGDCIAMNATISKYRMYKDTPQTYLNRCVLLENKGSSAPQKEV